MVDADLRQCFDRIPCGKLMARIKERIADKKILELIRYFLKQEILVDGEVKSPEETGTPQGATLSPLLKPAVFYLRETGDRQKQTEDGAYSKQANHAAQSAKKATDKPIHNEKAVAKELYRLE